MTAPQSQRRQQLQEQPELGLTPASKANPSRIPTVIAARIPRFGIHVARMARPELADVPLVIMGAADGKRRSSSPPVLRVVVADAGAMSDGVQPGMRLPEVMAACPLAVAVDLDEAALERAAEGILQAVGRYTPLVAAGWKDLQALARSLVIHADVRGCERLFGPPHVVAWRIREDLAALGHVPRLGIARDGPVATLAAMLAPDDAPRVIPVGTERGFLSDLPLEALQGLDPDVREHLRVLGVRDVEGLAALPTSGMRRRHGKAGMEALARARGEMGPPIALPAAPASHEVALTIEDPTSDMLRVQAGIEHVAKRVARELDKGGQATRRLTLRLIVERVGELSRTLHLKEPASLPTVLASLAGNLLGELAPQEPVAGLALSADDLCAAATQLSFPLPLVGQVDTTPVEAVRRRLRARFGPKAARKVRLVPALVPEEEACWDGEPSGQPVQLPLLQVREDGDGRPLSLCRREPNWEAVEAICAHWRLRTHWWSIETHRHYYRVETATGALLEVYADQAQGDWRLARVVD